MEPKKHPGGRPKLADHEKLVQRSIRLHPDHWAKIEEMGGLDELRTLLDWLTPEQWNKVQANGLPWLRKLIDKAKPPRE